MPRRPQACGALRALLIWGLLGLVLLLGKAARTRQTTRKPQAKLAPELAAMDEESVLALIANKRAFGGVVASTLVVDVQGQAIDTNDLGAGAATALREETGYIPELHADLGKVRGAWGLKACHYSRDK